MKEKPLTYTPPEKFQPFTPEEQKLLRSVSRRASSNSRLYWWVGFCKQIKAQGYISFKQKELLVNFNVEEEVQKSMNIDRDRSNRRERAINRHRGSRNRRYFENKDSSDLYEEGYGDDGCGCYCDN